MKNLQFSLLVSLLVAGQFLGAENTPLFPHNSITAQALRIVAKPEQNISDQTTYYTSIKLAIDKTLNAVNLTGRTTLAGFAGFGNHLYKTPFTEHAKNAAAGATLGAGCGALAMHESQDISDLQFGVVAGPIIGTITPIVRAACAEAQNEFNKKPEEVTISNEAALATGTGITILGGIALRQIILSFKQS